MLDGYGSILLGVASVFLAYGVYVIVGKTRDAAAAALEAYSPSSLDESASEAEAEPEHPELPSSPACEPACEPASEPASEPVMYYRTLARLADHKID
jgi:hypothetical protein